MTEPASSDSSTANTRAKTVTVDLDWLAEHDRQVAEKAWDTALDRAWELNDPAYTIFASLPSSETLPLLTRADVFQTKIENPYRAPEPNGAAPGGE